MFLAGPLPRLVCVAACLAAAVGLWPGSVRADEATVFRLDDASGRAVPASKRLEGTATAFVVAPGLLLTNEHVVRGHAQVVLRDVDAQTRVAATVVTSDVASDLALLSATVTATPLPVAEGATLAARDPVAVIGFPDPRAYGDGRKLAQGWVSEVVVPDRPGLFTMGISIRGGNSGSPVLSPAGQVVGVAAGGYVSPVRVDGVQTVSQSVGAGIRLDRVIPFLQKNNVPYRTFAYQGSLDAIVGAVAPAVFLVEVPAP